MAQSPASADAQFIDSLKTDISGIYFSQVAHYTPQKISEEFRKAVRDPALVADEIVMANLLFLIRKKNIQGLREDVSRLVAANQLKPAAQVSALKTLYALGGDQERNTSDYLVSQALAQLIQSGNPPEASPYVQAADRIGGPRTLIALKQILAEATNRQRVAEQREPSNHAGISRLDKVRSGLEAQVFTLTRKQEILGKPEPERTAGMVRAYLRRSADLSCWAYRDMIDHVSQDAANTVRVVLARETPSFLPVGGLSPEVRAKRELEIRLRGLALLETMRMPFTPDEQKLFEENAVTLRTQTAVYYPTCDWEDVLDRS